MYNGDITKGQIMECEFCEYLMATNAVTQGSIVQVACSGCTAMLGDSWEVWDMDVSAWDYAG